MDKRTLLFALAVFSTLFLVNLYFNSQYEEDLRKWNLAQESKKKQQLLVLEAETQEKTARAANLPLYVGYSDEKGLQAIASGIFVDNSYITTRITEPLKTLYVRPLGSQAALQKLQLSYQSDEGPFVYQSDESKPLPIGELPDIGNYELQAIEFSTTDATATPKIWLAEYTDGNVSIVANNIATIKKQLDPKIEGLSHPNGNLLLVFKSEKGYLPVGIYDTSKQTTLFLEDIANLKTQQVIDHEQTAISPRQKGEQQYFVLENDYQQLVFTNVGGALVEINLPFKSKDDKVSPVREIEFDRDILKNHPYNAHFPAHAYSTAGQNPTGPFEEHAEGKLGGYYPLIRRDLIESGKRQSIKLNPRYYALNLLSEYPEFSELTYTVKHFDSHSITFEAQQRQRRITKTFSLPKDRNAPYTFDLSIKIDGDKRGIWLSSGIPEVELFSGTPAPVLKYRLTRNNNSYVESVSLPEGVTSNSSVNPDWLCNSNGFFGIIVDPLSDVDAGYRAVSVPGQSVPSRLVEIDQNYDRFDAKDFPGYMLLSPLSSSAGTMNFRVFAGPFSSSVLKSVDAAYADKATGYSPDYIACQSYHGWFSFISEPFAKILFWMMSFFYSLTGSWAFSIILLTLALRVMLYPLNAWSTRSMLRMQQIAPMVSAIQEKYKKDPKKLQTEMMNLYREQKVNPMSGCVPLLIQMPFLIGMFDLLKSTFELRGASFIPGWIDNLTAPDVLFSWETPIFFIGNQFHLLPILLGVVMYFQQRMSMPSIPVEEMTDQQRQQKTMGTIMPLLFTFMFYNFPSGLNIYWLSSMLLAMLQQWWMQKRMKPITTSPASTVIDVTPAKKKN